MRKLTITQEELQILYEQQLNDILEQCDWITYVDSHLVCNTIYLALQDIGVEIDENKLHTEYMAEVTTLNLTGEEWTMNFGIKEIINLIYTIIETKDVFN